MTVPPHAAPVLNNDPPHLWQARFHVQHFVSLFLIFAEHIVRVREVHEVGELLGQAILIHPVGNAADTLGAERRIEQLRPVVADDRQEFLPLESQGPQPQPKRLRLPVVRGPGDRPPDPQLLLPEGDAGAEHPGVAAQQFRKRVRGGVERERGGWIRWTCDQGRHGQWAAGPSAASPI